MKKKPNSKAATVARLFVLLLAVSLLLSVTVVGQTYATTSSDQVERLNVMVVIDGSGSLVEGGSATDPKGVRYDAINLFLALLTNDGNNVGAIVFNEDGENFLLNSPIDAVSGKADKVDLAQKIQDAGAHGGTNIGAALLAAVEQSAAMSQQNGLDSVVILFSDGRTDVPGEEAMEASLNAKEEATTRAQQEGIPIYSLCLAATSKADPAELQEISDRTSGEFVSVTNAKDLTTAFETFYKLIFSSSSNEIVQMEFPEDGKISVNVDIPTYGAEEVNVILDTTNLDGRAITAPSGALSDTELEDTTMSGGYYDVIKLVDPETGTWQVELTGKPGEKVTINVLYNIDSVAQLQTADAKTDYGVGESVTFKLSLCCQGVPITDAAVTQEYTAKLLLTKTSDGSTQEVDMTANADGSFGYTMTGSEYASYTAEATLSFGELVLKTGQLPINFGNTAPVANPSWDEIKAVVTPISGKSKTVDLTSYFTDGQDATLTYSVVSSQLVSGTGNLDAATGQFVVNTGKSRSGDVVIQATDSQGASTQMTLHFNVTNLTGLIFGLLVAGVVGGAVALGVVAYGALNKPWHGIFSVKNVNGGMERSQGSFRGKIPLSRFGIVGAGLEGYFFATGRGQMEFRSKKPVYSNMSAKPSDRISLMGGINKIYADEAHTMGIQVDVRPKTAGGGFGGFGGMGGGGGTTNRKPTTGTSSSGFTFR